MLGVLRYLMVCALLSVAAISPVETHTIELGANPDVPGGHRAALTQLLDLAEQGASEAQLRLGMIYEQGQGVSRDISEAITWYHEAAEQDSAAAQHMLGRVFSGGNDVPLDYPIAYMWFSLAASQGDGIAGRDRAKIERLMTSPQIAEAQRLTREWTPQ